MTFQVLSCRMGKSNCLYYRKVLGKYSKGGTTPWGEMLCLSSKGYDTPRGPMLCSRKGEIMHRNLDGATEQSLQASELGRSSYFNQNREAWQNRTTNLPIGRRAPYTLSYAVCRWRIANLSVLERCATLRRVTDLASSLALVSKSTTMTLLAFSLKATGCCSAPSNLAGQPRSVARSGMPLLARGSLAHSGVPSLGCRPRLAGRAKSLAFRQNASNVPMPPRPRRP